MKASTSAVQTATAQVARTVDARQIEELTLNGRNPIFLALLKPGVRGGSTSTFNPDSVTNGAFSINGAREDEDPVTVDGAIATLTRSSGSMLGAQDVETVEEVQILTANYRAEYGRSSAGQIRFVTKSGTRDFHGDVLENYRDEALDANSWTRNRSGDPRLSNGPDPFTFHQFGFHLGGPVLLPGRFNADRSRMFFFWGEEWIYRRDTLTSTGTVPTEAMRRGDFSGAAEPGQYLLRPRENRRRSHHRPAVSGKHHPARSAQCQRCGLAECVPRADAGLSAGDLELDWDAVDLVGPAEGHRQAGLPDHAEPAADVPVHAHPLALQRTVRRQLRSRPVGMVAAEPDPRPSASTACCRRPCSTSSPSR